jgi:hypothetical protein
MDGARKGKCQEAAFSRRLEEPLKGHFVVMLKRSRRDFNKISLGEKDGLC